MYAWKAEMNLGSAFESNKTSQGYQPRLKSLIFHSHTTLFGRYVYGYFMQTI